MQVSLGRQLIRLFSTLEANALQAYVGGMNPPKLHVRVIGSRIFLVAHGMRSEALPSISPFYVVQRCVSAHFQHRARLVLSLALAHHPECRWAGQVLHGDGHCRTETAASKPRCRLKPDAADEQVWLPRRALQSGNGVSLTRSSPEEIVT